MKVDIAINRDDVHAIKMAISQGYDVTRHINFMNRVLNEEAIDILNFLINDKIIDINNPSASKGGHLLHEMLAHIDSCDHQDRAEDIL